MKHFFSSFLFLALIFNGNLALSQTQRVIGGTQLDLDDNTGKHLFLSNSSSSLGINASGTMPNTCALLDLLSTTKGLLVPRMTALQESAICGGTPPEGLIVYNLGTHSLDIFNGTVWGQVAGWGLFGNIGTNPAINFLGTTDPQDLVIRTNGTERLRVLSGGNLSVTSTAGTAINISGSASTSINANGLISTSGNLSVNGSSTFGPTGTPVTSVYKLVMNNIFPGFIIPANSSVDFGFGNFFNSSGFNPPPTFEDGVYVCPDPGVLPSGLIATIWMVASDAFTIRIANVTGAPIGLGAGNFTIIATRF